MLDDPTRTNGGGKNVHPAVYAREATHAHEGNETQKETLSETRVGKLRQNCKKQQQGTKDKHDASV